MSDSEFSTQLSHIRSRRWQLWLVFFSYLPVIAIALKTTTGNTVPFMVCGFWVLLAAICGIRVSFSKCPRCGNLFHMRGVSTSWGRRCRHCQLPLS